MTGEPLCVNGWQLYMSQVRLMRPTKDTCKYCIWRWGYGLDLFFISFLEIVKYIPREFRSLVSGVFLLHIQMGSLQNFGF
jgi:hypothetical protein